MISAGSGEWVVSVHSNRQEPDYRRLQKELQAGIIRPVYLFFGSQDYLLEQAVTELMHKITPAGGDILYNVVNGQETALGDVLDMAGTASLFHESRLLLVRDAPYFHKDTKADSAHITRLLAKASESCIVFCAREVTTTQKVYKELLAAQAVYRFDGLKAAALRVWVSDYTASLGMSMQSDTVDYFLARAGTDLRNLAVELDKIAAYNSPLKEISEKSIRAVGVRALTADIFALTEAAVYGQTAKALILLRDLLAAGEPPLLILTMISRQFRLLGEARDLLQAGEKNLAAALRIHPYAAEKLHQQVQKTDEPRIRRAVELLIRCELDIKQGRIGPVLALETLVVALKNQ